MRKIYCTDVFEFFKENIDEKFSTVSSIPDYSEFPSLTLEEWKNWFQNSAELILNATHDDEVAIFYQSDIKHNGEWVDKSFICQKAAEKTNHKLVWHKVICRVPPGQTTFGRPAYSHILCFSKNFKLDYSKSTADVIPHVGSKLWERGMGLDACLLITKFLKEQVQSDLVVNPFCGKGSLVSVLDAYELNVIGIEKSPKRAEVSERIQFSLANKSWLKL